MKNRLLLIVLISSLSAFIVTGCSTEDMQTVTNTSKISSEFNNSTNHILLADNNNITISESGEYIISGTSENSTITVDTDKENEVILCFENVTVTNSSSPVILVKSAKNVLLKTDDNTTSFTVSGSFTDKSDAVIYSKTNLILDGNFNIISDNGNGISCSDELSISNGSYNIKSSLDAFEAKNCITIENGNFVIESQKDGLHCENKNKTGTVVINNGTFDINSKDDGIQSTELLQINDGIFNINASEGLEATEIELNGGNITISASDDGINASKKSDTKEPLITINNGNINITVGQGDTDAIDSNGSIIVNGGNINITSTVSSFDFDSSAEFNGGTITVNGENITEIKNSMMFGREPDDFPGKKPDNMRPHDDFPNDFRREPPDNNHERFTPSDNNFPENESPPEQQN